MTSQGPFFLRVSALLLLLTYSAAQPTPNPPAIFFPPSPTPPGPAPGFTVALTGSASYITGQLVSLNAAINPGPVSRYQITWGCLVVSSANSTWGDTCPFSNQVALANGGTQLQVKPDTTWDYGEFRLTVMVTDQRNAASTGSASVTVTVARVAPWNVAINVTEGSAENCNPGQRLMLQGLYSVSSLTTAKDLRFRWSQAPTDSVQVNLSSSAVTSTGGNQSFLVIKPDVLTPGQKYLLIFTVTDPGGSTSANLTVSVSQPPRPTTLPGLRVSPSSGTPLSTAFTISAANQWTDGAGPLQYQFGYSLARGTAPAIQLTSFQPSATVVSILPSGLTAGNYQVTVHVSVMDSLGLVGSASLAVTSQWASSANINVTAASNDILSSVDTAVSAGNTSTALVYINGLSTLLNGNSGSGSGSGSGTDAAASSSSRFKMLQAVSTISSSLKSASKSALVSSLVSVAGTLSSIVAIPSQITTASQRVALDALTSSLTAVVAAGVTLNSAAVQPVFDTLSSLRQVSGSNAAQGLQIRGVTSQAAEALLAGVNPGEAPICVASAGIAMSVRRSDGTADLDLAAGAPGSDCSSALTSATFTVPSGALPGDTQVDSQVLVFAGDPYQTGETLLSTGVSGLVLTKPDGSAVQIKGVVTFNMPLDVSSVSTRGGLGSSARCEYFNETSANTPSPSYAKQGCVALPNPSPPGRSSSWKNNGVALKGAQRIEDLWSIDLTGTNCQESKFLLVDSNGNGFRRFTPVSPDFPCTLTEPTQACFFNETTQGFQGPGCVFDATLHCACTHLTDFAGVFTPPDVYVLSFADLSDLKSAYKTPVPLIVIGLLAVIMIVGDVLMRHFVRTQRRLVFLELMSTEIDGGWKGIPRYGFKAMPNGAFTWSFHEVLKGGRYTGAEDMNGDGQVNDADAFPGPAPLLAGKLGILYSRLCTALPTYTFITHEPNTPARRSPFPFSTSRAPSALEEEPPVTVLPSSDRLTPPGGKARAQTDRMTPPSGQKRTSVTRVNAPVTPPAQLGGRVSAPGSPSGTSTPERDPPVPAPGTEPMGIEEPAIVGESVVSRFVGTALVLGYLDAWGVLTSAECANYVSLAAAYFQQQGLLVAGDTSEVQAGAGSAFSMARQHALLVDFRAYMEKLKVMMWNNLNRRGWRRRAQIWRLVLLQQRDGSYDLHSDFARALRAPGIDDLDFAAQLAHQQRRAGGPSLKAPERLQDTPRAESSGKNLLAQSPKSAEPEPAEPKQSMMTAAANAVVAGIRFRERRGEEDINIFLDRNQTTPIATARSAHVQLLHDMKDLFDYLAWRVERSTGRVGVQFNTVLDLPHHQNLLDKKVYKKPGSRHINEQISRLSDVHSGMSLLCLYRANLAPRTSMRPRWWLKKITMLENRRTSEAESPEPAEVVEDNSGRINNELFENATVAVAQKTPESLRNWAENQPIPQGILGFVSAKVAQAEQSIFAAKVWATVLGCAFTRRQTETWLRSLDGGDGNPRAVFHSARAWLDDVVSDESLIDTWLSDADKVLDQWEEQLKQALQDVMKSVDAATVFRHLRKEGSRLLWQIRTITLKGTWNVLARRKLIAVFISTERWLSALIQRPGFVVRICCVWLGSLMINTWMHYSRTIKCCDNLKTSLCGGAFNATQTVGLCGLGCKSTAYIPPCVAGQTELGCGPLADMLSGYDAATCTAFPNGSTASSLWMALISFLLLLPVQIVMFWLFKASISSHVLLERWAWEGYFPFIKRTLVGLFSRTPPRPVPLPPPQMEQHPKSRKGRNAVAPAEPSSPRALLSNRPVADEGDVLAADVESARKKHNRLVGSAYAIAGLFFAACTVVIAIFSVKLYTNVGKGHENDVLKAYISAVVLQQCVWTGTRYLLRPAQAFLQNSALYYLIIRFAGDMFSWEEGLRDLGGFVASLNINLSLLTQAGGAFAVEAGAAASQAPAPQVAGAPPEQSSSVSRRTALN